MVYARCTNGVCVVARLTVALERMLLFCVEIIIVASNVAALGYLKKEEEEEEEENPSFNSC